MHFWFGVDLVQLILFRQKDTRISQKNEMLQLCAYRTGIAVVVVVLPLQLETEKNWKKNGVPNIVREHIVIII